MKKTLTIVSAMMAALVVASADNINLTVGGFQALEDSSNTVLANGNAVWIGSFSAGFDIGANANDFATLAANFGAYDDGGTFAGGTQMLTTTVTDYSNGFNGSFTVSGSVADAGGTAPAVYVWAFNNAVASSASEHGIFELSALESGVPPLGITQSLDLATNFVSAPVGSFSGGVATLQAVPEPSAFAALAGVMALGWVAVRRRRA